MIRPMRMLLCAVIALRLVTDLATPLLPGAFMLDESVEAHRASSLRAVDQVARPVTPARATTITLPAPRIAVPALPRSECARACAPRRPARHPLEHHADSSDDPLIATLAIA